jgi:hypothetical protein
MGIDTRSAWRTLDQVGMHIGLWELWRCVPVFSAAIEEPCICSTGDLSWRLAYRDLLRIELTDATPLVS